MAKGAIKGKAKGVAKRSAEKRATKWAGRKAQESSTVQQLKDRAKDMYTGPNRGKAIAATAAAGALAVYAIGPGRLVKMAPIAAAGIRSFSGRG